MSSIYLRKCTSVKIKLEHHTDTSKDTHCSCLVQTVDTILIAYRYLNWTMISDYNKLIIIMLKPNVLSLRFKCIICVIKHVFKWENQPDWLLKKINALLQVESLLHSITLRLCFTSTIQVHLLCLFN